MSTYYFQGCKIYLTPRAVRLLLYTEGASHSLLGYVSILGFLALAIRLRVGSYMQTFCFTGARVLSSFQTPDGIGPIWRVVVQCRGTETGVAMCPVIRREAINSCGHDDDIGVSCQPSDPSKYVPTSRQVSVILSRGVATATYNSVQYCNSYPAPDARMHIKWPS